MEPELMTVEQVQDFFGVTRQTVYNWRRDQGLPAYKVGNAVRFRRSELEAWFRASAEQKPAAEPTGEQSNA